MHSNPDEGGIRKLLMDAKRIAIVGLSPKPHRDSNRIACYLQEHGYEVVPVYPREDEILGQKASGVGHRGASGGNGEEFTLAAGHGSAHPDEKDERSDGAGGGDTTNASSGADHQ